MPNYRFEAQPIFTNPLIQGNLQRQNKKSWKEHTYTLGDNCQYFHKHDTELPDGMIPLEELAMRNINKVN